MIKKKYVTALVLLSVMLLGNLCIGEVLFETSFDAPYVEGAISGQQGWTTSGSISWISVVDSATYGGWTGHGRNLCVNAVNGYGHMPSVDSSSADLVMFSYEVRPGDNAKSNGSWASAVYLYGADNKAITSIWFIGDGVDPATSAGYIAVSNGATQWWDTGLDWAYVNGATSYSVDVTIDQANKTWSISVDGSAAVIGDWGGFMGNLVSDSTYQHALIRGGNNISPSGLSSYDNIKIETIPEPVSILCLLAAAPMLVRKNRR